MNLISLRQITESELPTLLQVLSGRASGRFPSPAADHYEAPISLDDLVDLRAPRGWLGETEGDTPERLDSESEGATAFGKGDIEVAIDG